MAETLTDDGHTALILLCEQHHGHALDLIQAFREDHLDLSLEDALHALLDSA